LFSVFFIFQNSRNYKPSVFFPCVQGSNQLGGFTIDGDGFELALSQELSEEFEIDFSPHLGGLVAEVSCSLIEMVNLLTRGSLCSSFSRSSLSIPMKLPHSKVLMWFILILLVEAFSKTRS
jgi:hypothetical protein